MPATVDPDQALDAKVSEWLRFDVFDPETRAEIEELARSGAEGRATLSELLLHRMTFGTAGLRARMGAGYARMNALTVIQATQGLCRHLVDVQGDAALAAGAVIGYDHRFKSQLFARAAAAVFTKFGFKRVILLEGPVHTPLVPFTIVSRKCAAGVMVTASHNPKLDNGFKVYWQNGCQIVPPHDSGIAACIEKDLEPCVTRDDVDGVPLEGGENAELTSSIKADYLSAIKNAIQHPLPANAEAGADGVAPDDTVVYTAMHGVGWSPIRDMFEAFGLEQPAKVDAQCSPDPNFPTVSFPNPEEAGALDLAMAEATKIGASLVVANDPDADRLAAAEFNKIK